MKKQVSVVIPAYNEEINVAVIVEKINSVFAKLSYQYEIILIDDGSDDDMLCKAQAIASCHPSFFYIELSRNFGHQLALKAGLDHAKGDCVISLDCDLQHPPALIAEMLAKWEEGYEVVYTRRIDDRNLGISKRKTSEFFYKILNRLSDIELETGTADFRLLDRKVVHVFRNFQEKDPFVRGLIKWMGFKQYAIDYHAGERHSGESKYTFKKMIRFAVQGVTSFSIKPLYTAVYLGFFFSLASLLYIPYVIYAFCSGQEVSGWASLIITIVFLGGLQLTVLGVIGIYVGKMFMQTKNRPNYIIRNTNLR